MTDCKGGNVTTLTDLSPFQIREGSETHIDFATIQKLVSKTWKELPEETKVRLFIILGNLTTFALLKLSERYKYLLVEPVYF
jgi:hypothetical protein